MTEQTKESLNRFIHEWLGKCWHEIKLPQRPAILTKCLKCGESVSIYSSNPDYLTWTGLGEVLRISRKHKRWSAFWRIKKVQIELEDCSKNSMDVFLKLLNTIDPGIFIPEWCRFLGWKEEE